MISLKKALTAPALGAIIGMAVLSASSPAAARIVCNAEGDCWHTERAPVVPGIRFNIHPDDWYFHQHWDADREHHYRDYHEGRGYYKSGIWIPL